MKERPRFNHFNHHTALLRHVPHKDPPPHPQLALPASVLQNERRAQLGAHSPAHAPCILVLDHVAHRQAEGAVLPGLLVGQILATTGITPNSTDSVGASWVGQGRDR